MKFLIFATNGTEDSELVSSISLFKRAGIESTLVTTSSSLLITGSHSTKIMCDKLLSDMPIDEIMTYDAVFYPGGKRGVNEMKENEKALEVARLFDNENKYILAICAGPTILSKAGIIKDDTKYTCYDGFENEFTKGIYVPKASVIISNNIITGRSAGYVIEFSLAIIKFLVGEDALKKVESGILKEI